MKIVTMSPDMEQAQYCIPYLYISAGTPSIVMAEMWLENGRANKA